MQPWTIQTQSYFDGEVLHRDGPYYLRIEDGRIGEIGQGEEAGRNPRFADTLQASVPFVMPGLVEAHAHLFLNGSTLEFPARSAYLKGPVEDMLETARANVQDSLECGITLIRDAADKFGINHAVREEVNGRNDGPLIRSSGVALHRAKNYGAFMARPVGDADEIRAVIAETAEKSDDLKIILTGIIDFEAGTVTAPVQFSVDELKMMVAEAGSHGLPTFAHCSGIEGIRIAAEAGIGSIEHGFFMDRAALEVIAEKQIAWVQTYSPVHFQWARPEFAKWKPETIAKLRKIVDDHLEHAAIAHKMGVQLVAGSDAGSHGVPHGSGLIDELFFLLEAGLPMAEVLTSATSRPRRLWGAPANRIATGETAEFITLGDTPFAQADALRDVRMVVREGRVLHEAPTDKRGRATA